MGSVIRVNRLVVYLVQETADLERMGSSGAAEAQRPQSKDPEPLHEDRKASLHPVDDEDVRVCLLSKPGPPPPEHLGLGSAQMDARRRRGPRARLAPGEDMLRLGGRPCLMCLLLLLLLLLMMMMMLLLMMMMTMNINIIRSR